MITLLDVPNPAGLAENPLDALIVAVILLFILSTITEKFTELLRMYPYQSKMLGLLLCITLYILIFRTRSLQVDFPPKAFFGLLLCNLLLTVILVVNIFFIPKHKAGTSAPENGFTRLFSVLNNVAKGKVTTEDEKIKEVTFLSYMVGLVVTFLFNASLFSFFDTSNAAKLQPISPFASNQDFALDPKFFNFTFISLIGYLLTAFFLSFGARFFHDLLDNLLQVKNLKRKLNEKADYDFDKIEDFDNYLKAQERPLFEAFLRKNLEGPGIFFESKFPEMEVIVHRSDDSVKVQDNLFYQSLVGKRRTVKVSVKSSPEIQTLSIPLFASSNIANQSPFNNLHGTLAYQVFSQADNKSFFLTCYHVVWNGHDWDNFNPAQNSLIVHPIGGVNIGTAVKAIKNRLIDAALIEPSPDVDFQGLISGIGQVNNSRVLDPENDLNIGVKMNGSSSGKKLGRIAEFNKSAQIRYPDGQLRYLDNLILIKPIEGAFFSKGGDSGALILDSFDVAIAMLVAGDEADISLAIPFSTLRDQLNIKI
ncbi:hypothetical protein [Pedobacter paludis]|uniref:Uncharacterized protein n=1 Tax=Pedobacter paludis TaxID=2203212 RepID=A0A317F2H8_9SPHI|nr:hypothetical protein [Pedobacter paludis]PWS33374.1 hypothetical protein DF947_01740 [Pedobacter paludis]